MEISPESKKRLSALIEERDAALAPLAAKIGVSQSTLWNFIYGNTKNFSKIHVLATELRVSLDWILNGDAAPAQMEPGASHMSEHLPQIGRGPGGLSESDKIFIREIAIAAAALAKAYPALEDETVGAILLSVAADLKSGKVPMPRLRGKNLAKTIMAEAQRLADYELNK